MVASTITQSLQGLRGSGGGRVLEDEKSCTCTQMPAVLVLDIIRSESMDPTLSLENGGNTWLESEKKTVCGWRVMVR